MEITRRQMVGVGTVAAALCGLPFRVALAGTAKELPLHFGRAVPSRPAAIVELARHLSTTPFQPAPPALSETLAALAYDEYRDIRYQPEASLWRREKLPFELQF